MYRYEYSTVLVFGSIGFQNQRIPYQKRGIRVGDPECDSIDSLKTDSIDNFLESLTEYDLALTPSAGAGGASSWLTSPPQVITSRSHQSSFKAPSYGAKACLSTPPMESIGARRENDIP